MRKRHVDPTIFLRWKDISKFPPQYGKQYLFTNGEVVWLGIWTEDKDGCHFQCIATKELFDLIDGVSHYQEILLPNGNAPVYEIKEDIEQD